MSTATEFTVLITVSPNRRCCGNYNTKPSPPLRWPLLKADIVPASLKPFFCRSLLFLHFCVCVFHLFAHDIDQQQRQQQLIAGVRRAWTGSRWAARPRRRRRQTHRRPLRRRRNPPASSPASGKQWTRNRLKH
jgi:hypothetical protein